MKNYKSMKLEGQNYEIEFKGKLFQVSKVQREWITVINDEKSLTCIYSHSKKGIMDFIIHNNSNSIIRKNLIKK